MSDFMSEKVLKASKIGNQLLATDQKVGGSNPLVRNPSKIATNPVFMRICGYYLFEKVLPNIVKYCQNKCPICVR